MNSDTAEALQFLLSGLRVTLLISAGGVIVAALAAFVAGTLAGARSRWLRGAARTYVELFRGSSAFVQLYWVFYVLPLLLGIRLPAEVVGVLVLGLNVGAYGAEVVRGAIAGVGQGQRDAARALGITGGQQMARVILPQAIPAMIPTFGNLVIELLKGSALVTFITLHDLMWAAGVLRGRAPDKGTQIYLQVMLLFGISALVFAGVVALFGRRSIRTGCGRPLQQVLDWLTGLQIGDGYVLARLAERFRWLGHLVGAAATVGALGWLLARAARYWDWSFTAAVVLPTLIKGLGVTLAATAVAAVLALTCGVLWACLRQLRQVALPLRCVLECVRSTPLLVQLFLLYYGILPAMGVTLSPFWVGTVVLGLHYSCYTAEVYRGGIEAVPTGQREAAVALGLSPRETFLRIVLPQAVPRALPALGNYVVAMLKETPLLSTITVLELMGMAEEVQADHFRGMEAFTLVGGVFLVLSLAAAALTRQAERWLPVRHA